MAVFSTEARFEVTLTLATLTSTVARTGGLVIGRPVTDVVVRVTFTDVSTVVVARRSFVANTIPTQACTVTTNLSADVLPTFKVAALACFTGVICSHNPVHILQTLALSTDAFPNT